MKLHSGLLKPGQFSQCSVRNTGINEDDAAAELYMIDEPVEDIFAYVFEYLYTGDYTVLLTDDIAPQCTENDDSQSTTQGLNVELEWNIFESSESVQKWSDYLVRRLDPQPSLPSNGGKHQYYHGWDYSRPLLTHARLNDFAERYEFCELRDICLFKLLHMLNEFPLHETRVRDITQLIQFVFRDGCRKPENADNIQTLMLHFTMWHMKLFAHNEEFPRLLRDVPLFCYRLLQHMCSVIW